MNRVFHILSWLAILGMLGLVVASTYLYLFDGNPPAVLTLPYHTEKTTYLQGEALTILSHICKTHRYPLTTYPSLVKIPEARTNPPIDGKVFQLPAIKTVGTPVGCKDNRITGFFSVPADLPPGRYYLKGTNVFQVNFLTTRSLDWYTNGFTVTARN